MTDNDSDNLAWLHYLVREFGGHSVTVVGIGPSPLAKDWVELGDRVPGWHPGNKALTLAALREAVALADAADRQTVSKAARMRSTRRSGPIRNVTTRRSYANAAEAAQQLGVSASAVANHLNNPARVPTVAGCILMRVKP